MTIIPNPTDARSQALAEGRTCTLCHNDDHHETLSLLTDTLDPVRHLSDDALLAEAKYVQREMVEARERGRSPNCYIGQRLPVIETELDRRRRLEAYGGPRVPTEGRIPSEIIRTIKEATDLSELLADDLDGIARMSGGKPQFRCRFHGTDSTPSLIIYDPDTPRERWCCFGCGESGDAFDWLIKAHGMEWLDAVKYLAGQRGIDLRPPVKRPKLVEVRA